MKHKIGFIFFWMTWLFASAQTINADVRPYIQKDFAYFIYSMKAKKIPLAVDCIYPKFFTLVPKSQMVRMLNFTYNNPILKTEIVNFKVLRVEKPEKVKEEYFSMIDYSFGLNLKINWKAIPNLEKQKENLYASLVKKYGKNNIVHDKKADIYHINATMRACAISSNQSKWTFLIIEPEYKNQLKKILPEKIWKRI